MCVCWGVLADYSCSAYSNLCVLGGVSQRTQTQKTLVLVSIEVTGPSSFGYKIVAYLACSVFFSNYIIDVCAIIFFIVTLM